MMRQPKMHAIDLFSGCGGLSEGLRQANFNVVAGVEIDKTAALTYKMNHPDTVLLQKDIRSVSRADFMTPLNGSTLHLLAGCPPCQGFSSMRRLNKKSPALDARNQLISEYYRLVKLMRPLTIMLENVPGIADYDLFTQVVGNLKKLGYHVAFNVVDVAHFSVPQRRRRMVLVGSKLGPIAVAKGGDAGQATVRDALSVLSERMEFDELHDVYTRHSPNIQEMISLIPKNGGGRKDLPERYQLECHKKENVGFSDVYGRLKWDAVSSTITGGCLSPSKGRFLHPEENRGISAREAALLQTFPLSYKFPVESPKRDLALMIGNALPPKFCRAQARNIYEHLVSHLG